MLASVMRFLSLALVLTATMLSAAPLPASAQSPGTQEAKKLSDAFVQIADKTGPSVVQIDVTSREENDDPLLKWLGKRGGESPVARGMGSGVLFTADGAILTNNHVIESALSMNVRLRDGRHLPARLIGRDPSTDLAVIKIDAPGLVPAKFADSDAARVGEWVVAIGSPYGLGYTVTTGVLSAKGRGGMGMNAIEDYLQTDASINPGNSGGPLCDLDGRVIGINTMIVGRGSGIGFAVPANMARRVADQMLKKGKVERAWLGVGIQDLTPELAQAFAATDMHAGALINQVTTGGPGQKANLKSGDIIMSVGGKKISDTRELIREVLVHDVGQTVQLEILRDAKKYGTRVVLSARPEPVVAPIPMQQQSAPQAGMGLGIKDLAPAQAAQLGLGKKAFPVVTSVAPGSPADRAGLKVNDIITEANHKADQSSAQVIEAGNSGKLLLRVFRKGSSFWAALKK